MRTALARRESPGRQVGYASVRQRTRLPRDLASIFVAAAVVLVARASLADHYVVPTGSMEPTVEIGDHIFVDKLAYGLRVPFTRTYLVRGEAPARGDVVVLESPTEGDVLLKRVVAVAGDVVEVEGGRVTIDGRAAPVTERDGGVLEELGNRTHALGTDYGGGPSFGPTLVPEGKVLVLGDNRGNSKDGRYFGWVDRDAVLGRAVSVCVRDRHLVWRGL